MGRALCAVLVIAVGGLVATPAAQTSTPWRDPSPHKVHFLTVDGSVRIEVLDWGGS